MQSEAIINLIAHYDAVEDRIRLDCELHTEEMLRLYMTQRFSKNIVAQLVKIIEASDCNHTRHSLSQHFAVQSKIAASNSLVGQEFETHLIQKLHFQNVQAGYRILLEVNEERGVHLQGDLDFLRNILDIFHKSFLRAQWPTQAFPSWIVPPEIDHATQNSLN